MKKLVVKSSQECLLNDLFIDGEKFNGCPGKVEVPEYVDLQQDITPKLDGATQNMTVETSPVKVQNAVRKTERELVNRLSNALGVPRSARKEYL